MIKYPLLLLAGLFLILLAYGLGEVAQCQNRLRHNFLAVIFSEERIAPFCWNQAF